jgi:hypothetical protein
MAHHWMPGTAGLTAGDRSKQKRWLRSSVDIVPEDYVRGVAHFQRKRIGRFQNWQTVRAIRMTQDIHFPLIYSSGSVGFAKLAARIVNRAVSAAKLSQPFAEVWLDRN